MMSFEYEYVLNVAINFRDNKLGYHGAIPLIKQGAMMHPKSTTNRDLQYGIDINLNGKLTLVQGPNWSCFLHSS